jgi:hypothetical protein
LCIDEGARSDCRFLHPQRNGNPVRAAPRRRSQTRYRALGVVVDAIDDRAQTFYEKYGFRQLNDPPQRSLFLKMSKVAALEKLFSPTTR